jgi:hypothetical protein
MLRISLQRVAQHEGQLEKQKLQANFQWCIDSTRSGFIVVAPGQFAIENFAARFKKTSACH